MNIKWAKRVSYFCPQEQHCNCRYGRPDRGDGLGVGRGGALQAGLHPRPGGLHQVTRVISRNLSNIYNICICRWPGFRPGVGDTMMTGTMGDRPEVGWAAQPGQLYTIMVLDEGIASLGGKQYVHWLVTNVPGTY